MTHLTITTSQLFNGHEWRGPATVYVEGSKILKVGDPIDNADIIVSSIMPGLVDYGVSAAGYSVRLDPEHPFAPEEAFGALCLRYGITTIIDTANQSSALAFIQAAGTGDLFPRILYGGARLSTDPQNRHDLLVTHRNCEQVVQAQVGLGASFISLGKINDASIVQYIVDLAQAQNLPLVWGNQYDDVPGLFWTQPKDTPIGEGSDWASAIKASAVYYAPQIEASKRWTVDGLLTANYAGLASPVIPYARHFSQMTGLVGRRIGKGMLNQIYGHRKSEMLNNGLMFDLSRSFAERNACFASSGAVTAGIVPGLSLWYELQHLLKLLGNLDKALVCATSAGVDLWPELRLGLIDTDQEADLLLFDEFPGDDSVMEFGRSLHTVVASGYLYDVAELDKKVNFMIEKALREAI